MPKCDSCGNFYDDPNDLELVRNKDNRWVSICRACSGRGVDVDLVTAAKIAVDDSAMALADKPGVDIPVAAGDPIKNAAGLLEALRNLRQTTERVGRIRAHERRKIELTVNFSLVRDDVVHEGIVRDLSQNGIKINTRRQLDKGQIVQFDWKPPLPPALANILQGTAEVRRVTKNTDDTFDVGLRFVNRNAGKGANRRRFRRYKCDMRAYYQRDGSEIMAQGQVKDISQGGCQMMAKEPFDTADKFTVRLMGGGGSRGDLVGTVQVCRVIPREVEYEIGCAFIQMRMGRLGESRQKTADSAAAMAVD
ncbi:MAG: PilZ domain-containing protein [Planctomycetota bacterium]|jgi:hypothetical protein|nr:PilZ domain-containing protein [Planctomycetota bacterium]